MISNLLKTRNNYSVLALFFIFIGEVIAFLGIQDYIDNWQRWLYVILTLLIFLWVIGLMSGKNFGVRSVIMTKLLANAIAPRRLGVLYLFFFVVHIGWLTNAAMSLFMPSYDLPELTTNVLICLMGMFFLVCFFPNGGIQKVDNPRQVFISGISNITVPYTKDYTDLNIRPLVRILQNVEDDNSNCEMLILKSDFNNSPEGDVKANIIKVLEFIESPKSKNINAEMSVNDLIALLIREVAQKEFPNKAWLNNMPIEFTGSCNYNMFNQCFNAIEQKVRDKDDKNHQLFFNLTPGTGIVGSLMTLLAIDGDRLLFYYSQDKSISDTMRVKEVDKSNIPLHNLLSQALEKIENN